VTALWSAATDDFTALVWLGKSLLAELTSDVASLWIFVTCNFRPPMSPLEAALVSPLTEFSRSLRSEQYAGLLLPPQPVSATSATAPNITTDTRSHARHGPSGELCRIMRSPDREDTVDSFAVGIRGGFSTAREGARATLGWELRHRPAATDVRGLSEHRACRR
jgi:hypothetical protein